MRALRRRPVGLMASVVVVGLILSGCGSTKSGSSSAGSSSGGASSSGASPSGGAAGSVTLGLLADVTGSLESTTAGFVSGAEAAIALQNAKGGVDGRKIKLAVGDDQSSPNDALAVTQSLVQQKHAFAVMEESAFFTLDYKYLEQQGIPAITELADDGGPEWADPTTHDLVEGAGASSLTPTAASWSWLVQVLKAEQCTKLATIAQGAVQTGVRYANGIKAAVQAAGIQVVDEDNSLGLTQTDLTPNALKMKALAPTAGMESWAHRFRMHY